MAEGKRPPVQFHPAALPVFGDGERVTFVTCGSVDDGKSTLIGRLLFDSGLVMEDQLQALRGEGAASDAIDLAFLVDGLEAEREQKITIDVAYRHLRTPRRSFIIADSPGHEQYTRNMATAASNADVAIVLVDARKGLLPQTRRHAIIASLLGIRHLMLAVNKMDLVGWEQSTFERIAADFRQLAGALEFAELAAVPISALEGDNVMRRSSNAEWYRGATLIEWLEGVQVSQERAQQPFSLAVQWVNRPNLDFRGYAGTVASGRVRPGDAVRILPGDRRSRIQKILGFERTLPAAVAGEAVTLVLEDESDVGRGDVIAAPDGPLQSSDQYAANLFWMAEQELLPGRAYWLRLGSAEVQATITELKYRLDVNTLRQEAAKTLGLNEIAAVNIATERPLAFAPYRENRDLGGFVLIDRQSQATVAAGTITFGLRRAANLFWHHLDVNRAARAEGKGQSPTVLWFTGFSGSGKSTIANLVERKLHALGRHTYLLDGDNVRHGLNRDLGFTDADRVENVRRVAEVAWLMADAGLIVLVSFISPFRAERQLARDRMAAGEFYELFVNTPLDICETRDPKGLYAKARAGQILNFTGIDSPYEPPLDPEMELAGGTRQPEELADQIVARLLRDARI